MKNDLTRVQVSLSFTAASGYQSNQSWSSDPRSLDPAEALALAIREMARVAAIAGVDIVALAMQVAEAVRDV